MKRTFESRDSSTLLGMCRNCFVLLQRRERLSLPVVSHKVSRCHHARDCVVADAPRNDSFFVRTVASPRVLAFLRVIIAGCRSYLKSADEDQLQGAGRWKAEHTGSM